MSKSDKKFKEKIHEIIFETDTREGKLFDIVLIIFIIASVIIVMLETVPEYQLRYGKLFYTLEWVFTIIFTIEYILRLYCVLQPLRYAKSFYGVIDLVSIIPTFLSIFIAGSQSLLIIRSLRLLRIFRIFKLANLFVEGLTIVKALRRSIPKISVFLFTIMLITIIFGSIMYIVEGDTNGGFDSIPRSVYWAIVTLTTVGYGDISPTTSLGQFIAAFVMLLGYAVIAVPTGIVTGEFIKQQKVYKNTQHCINCNADRHDDDARYCKTCGHSLHIEEVEL